MSSPKVLLDFLANLSDSEAEKIWLWLDGNPDAIETMIEAICRVRGWGAATEPARKAKKLLRILLRTADDMR